MLEVKELICGYGKKRVVGEIDFSVRQGEVICVLGANGIGKTTFFKSILGYLKTLGGEIKLDEQNIQAMSRREIAKYMGYVPQAHRPPFPFKVLEVVTMGRTAYISIFAQPSAADYEIAEKALKMVGMSHLKDRLYTEISGGERQLVLIARALAQQPKILVMDEPTANLDFGNQIKMLNNIKMLSKQGISIVVTTHNPDHAFFCSDKILVFKNRNEVISGSAEEMLTPKILKEIYGIDIEIKRVKLHKREAIVCLST